MKKVIFLFFEHDGYSHENSLRILCIANFIHRRGEIPVNFDMKLNKYHIVMILTFF